MEYDAKTCYWSSVLEMRQWTLRGFICVFLSLAVYGENFETPMRAFADSVSRKSGGGIIGGSIGYMLVKGFGIIGAYIIDVIMLIVSLVVITGKSAMKGMKKQAHMIVPVNQLGATNIL